MLEKKQHRSEKKLAMFRADYEAIKQQISALGQVVPGSLQKRLYRCGKPNCRCVIQGILHGPYYQWSRKIDGKTVNINLNRETATMVRRWIQNDRKLRKLCARLEKTSLAMLHIIADLDKA